jgi:hypothetical protein
MMIYGYDINEMKKWLHKENIISGTGAPICIAAVVA